MKQPNIVFIFPDQWRGDCLGVAGHPVVETPFLDELASQGTRFTSAYSPCPTCIGTRACLATGLTPYQAGRQGYQDGVPWTYRDTFMRLLRDGGYQTLCSGKTHFYPPRVRLGFEELALYEMVWQAPDRPSDYHQWLRRETHGMIRDTAEELSSNSWLAQPWTHPEHLHPTCWTTTRAIDMLENRDTTRPFLLQVNYHRPHQPFDPPIATFERFLDKELPPVPVGDWAAENDHPVSDTDAYDGRVDARQLDRARRAYYAQMAHIDKEIGRLFRYLRGRQLDRDCWIVFASDHGELLGDHHLLRKAPPFEGSAHVPLIIRPPLSREAPRGDTCDEPLTHSDLMPTLLDMAGEPVPSHVDGRSLLPETLGQPHPAPRLFIHGEHAPFWQFVTDGREKYCWHTQQGREWFFDLREDPQECRNLSALPAEQERVARWRQRLVDVLEKQPENKLVQDGKLVAGVTFKRVRESLFPNPT